MGPRSNSANLAAIVRWVGTVARVVNRKRVSQAGVEVELIFDGHHIAGVLSDAPTAIVVEPPNAGLLSADGVCVWLSLTLTGRSDGSRVGPLAGVLADGGCR